MDPLISPIPQRPSSTEDYFNKYEISSLERQLYIITHNLKEIFQTFGITNTLYGNEIIDENYCKNRAMKFLGNPNITMLSYGYINIEGNNLETRLSTIEVQSLFLDLFDNTAIANLSQIMKCEKSRGQYNRVDKFTFEFLSFFSEPFKHPSNYLPELIKTSISQDYYLNSESINQIINLHNSILVDLLSLLDLSGKEYKHLFDLPRYESREPTFILELVKALINEEKYADFLSIITNLSSEIYFEYNNYSIVEFSLSTSYFYYVTIIQMMLYPFSISKDIINNYPELHKQIIHSLKVFDSINDKMYSMHKIVYTKYLEDSYLAKIIETIGKSTKKEYMRELKELIRQHLSLI